MKFVLVNNELGTISVETAEYDNVDEAMDEHLFNDDCLAVLTEAEAIDLFNKLGEVVIND